jgi:hypothetical protein
MPRRSKRAKTGHRTLQQTLSEVGANEVREKAIKAAPKAATVA